jgi:hypothetical protein
MISVRSVSPRRFVAFELAIGGQKLKFTPKSIFLVPVTSVG